eukprot:3361010-Rhodomonas_salina.2
MPGTDVVYADTSLVPGSTVLAYAMSRTGAVYAAMSLVPSSTVSAYQMSGTDIACADLISLYCPVLIPPIYGLCGTGIAYADLPAIRT